MKYKEKEYLLDSSKISDIWMAFGKEYQICGSQQAKVSIRGNKKKFRAEKQVCCALERIEDTIDYINSYEFCKKHTGKNAFDFIEFINCLYVIVHCVKILADVFEVDYSRIKDERKAFSEFKYGNGTDYEVFEYVRSLSSVHPLETSHHPTVHSIEEFDCSPKIVWDDGGFFDDRDLCLVVYSSNSEDVMYISLKIEWFIEYTKVWLGLMDDIEEGITLYVKSEKERFRKIDIKKPEEFDNYCDYIDNLRSEYLRRCGDSHLFNFEKYKLVFKIDFENLTIQAKKKCYENAVMYMFDFLHKQIQEMSEREFTGIVDLKDDDYTTLFYELCYPVACGSVFSDERSSFTYIDNLKSIHPYEVALARSTIEKIKNNVNEYVAFNNDETPDETDLLVQIATYFDSLSHPDSYIGRSIPNEEKYRGVIDK